MTTKKTPSLHLESTLGEGSENTFAERVKTQTKKIFNILTLKNDDGKVIKPKVKGLGMLSYVEVLGLMHAEEGLEMFPFDMYTGTMKGTIEFDKPVPSMKRLAHIEGASRWSHERTVFFQSNQRMINEIISRGYITESEISFFKRKQKAGECDFVIEDIPAVFIIADKNSKIKVNVPQVNVPESTEAQSKKDPIVLMKYGENQFYPVHSRNNSQQLDAKIAKLN